MKETKKLLFPALLALGLFGATLTVPSIVYAGEGKNGEGGCKSDCGTDPDPGPGPTPTPTPNPSPSPSKSDTYSKNDFNRDNDNEFDGFTSKPRKDRPYSCLIANQFYFVSGPQECNYLAGYGRAYGNGYVSDTGRRSGERVARRRVARNGAAVVVRERVARNGAAVVVRERVARNGGPVVRERVARTGGRNGKYNYGLGPNYGAAGCGYSYGYDCGDYGRSRASGGVVVRDGFIGSPAAVAQARFYATRAGYGNGTGGQYVGNGYVTGPVPVARNVFKRRYDRVYAAPCCGSAYVYGAGSGYDYGYDSGVNVHYGRPTTPYIGY